MGAATGKQNRVCREIQEEFRARVSDRSDFSDLFDGQKTEISQVFSVFRSEIAWPDEARRQFCTVPELIEECSEPHRGDTTWLAYYY